jgi:voltage-gated sodium channel
VARRFFVQKVATTSLDKKPISPGQDLVFYRYGVPSNEEQMDVKQNDMLPEDELVGWRRKLISRIEQPLVQRIIIGVILINSVVLGLETSPEIWAAWSGLLKALDTACLVVFIVEIAAKNAAYGRRFWRSGWNIFDFLVVAVALIPGSGVWSILRSLRVLRVLRLLTIMPSLRKVVAAFLHAIPGLLGVLMVMLVFFYTAAVLATKLFSPDFPHWFGSLAKSLYTLFQIMTLESWSMGIVRPVMEVQPLAWIFFIPFIIIATFTILNLFIGIIVSTMQELAIAPEFNNLKADPEVMELLTRIDCDLRVLREIIGKEEGQNKPENEKNSPQHP